MPAELINFAPFIILLVLFYFLLIRPQQQQQKKRKELLDSLKVGDDVRTIGGFYGTIEKINDDVVTLRVADNVRLRLARFGVESVVQKDQG
ncbi:preprotein translocase subunit YajC [Dethiobacter alkaliphilus]|uniref:preprotein translocase subunit YajC n=1 Tax=Dethiobacter alkaliphilus TaxID=427926 RepID=UPI002226BFA2|nr:preprotein translocase subunit YajC [Dethiobacter alkaliphilus]MCW3490793.1 preprotein translocase subunit YajC [Dethiobacter alkaliphilus]